MSYYQCLNCNKDCKTGRSKLNKFCSQSCQKEFEYKNNIKLWLSGNHPGGNKYRTAGWVKRYVLEKQEYKCLDCGISDYNNKPINLELDHIDGDPYNNNINNLRCICPNCHSQSSNYKNRNKGNGRHFRRDRYANGTSY